MTNDDVINLQPAMSSEAVSDNESGIGTDETQTSDSSTPKSDPDPEKTRRKIERVLTTLKPYSIPERLINDGGKGVNKLELRLI